MKKIFFMVKKRFMLILLVLAMLVAQANCNLLIPDYVANIINIGISQNGVEQNTPLFLNKEDYDKLLIIAESDLDKEIEDSYIDLSKSNFTDKEIEDYKDKYGISEGSYILLEDKELNKEFEELNLMYMLLSTEIKDFNGVESFTYLGNLSDDLKGTILNDIKKNLDDKLVPEMSEQASLQVVKIYYENALVDLEHIQMVYILKEGAVMIGLAFLAMALTIGTVYVSARIASGISKDLRKGMVHKAATLANDEYEKFTTSSLITRSTNDIMLIQTFIVMAIKIVFYAPILGLGAYAKVAGSQMNWVIGISLLAIISVIIILFSFTMSKFKKIQLLIDKLNLVTKEILSGIPVIRAFGTEKHEENRFDDVNKDVTKNNLFVNRSMSMMFPMMNLIMNLTTVLIVFVGAQYVDDFSMQIGNIMSTITFAMYIFMSFLMFSMISIMMPRALVAFKRVGEVLSAEPSIENPKDIVEFPKSGKGVVEFKNVSFKYSDADDYTLKDISFIAKPGKVLAIIGSTGSGKSSLINLIPRFNDVTEGEILIDGVNIKYASLNSLRDRIGYTPQKGMLFSGTIKSNIGFGIEDENMKTIESAAKVAQATDFINGKKDKFDSEISEGATNVSGGQRQRLAIARTIAKNPNIYIFDDSFSALDFKTDATLRSELSKITRDSTIIIVAQRINTILNADEILVLEEGNLVGKGTHSELIKNCEIYKEIASSQLSEEEL